MKQDRFRVLGHPVIALLISALMLVGDAAALAGAQEATPAARPADLAGVAPLPLTGERRAEFEAYVTDALLRFGVPGASVAVVQNGQVVYLNGFGVRERGGTQAVTPDTMFMIGSITKSLTTMLAAALVDDGRLTWDTPLVDLLPDFAVGDPDLTRSLTVRDAFCNCVGIPGRNLEFYFQSALAPAEVVTALADTVPNAARGERYQYNNLLIAAGGYALGAAAGGAAYDVGLAYDTALRTRVLGPMGMTRSTFDPDEVLAGGDFALPHGADLAGEVQPLPLIAERSVLPVRPAGGLWSNAREMARYLQTALARGVAPSGTRVVSAETLAETWAPQVTIPAFPGVSATMSATRTGYGLGWMSGEYRGLRVISHAGGTNGFSAEIAFLPEADFGIVVLTNSLDAGMVVGAAFPYAVQFRLFELLFDQPPDFDAEATALAADAAASRPQFGTGEVDPADVEPYLGRYAHPRLGEVTLSWRGDRLVLDTGESSTELTPRASDGSGATVYLLHDPPLSAFSEVAGATVMLSGSGDVPRLTLTIPANPTGAEQAYEFERVDAAET